MRLEGGFASEHRRWMIEALKEAQLALSAGDVPVGAVIVHEGRIIGRGHNQRELLKDPTAHAEILAITAAASEIGDWRLEGCDIYVTLEPCPMCASAIQQARMRTVIFGAFDRVMGAVESRLRLYSDPSLGKPVEVIAPVLEEECSALLTKFFKSRRTEGGI